MKRIFVMAVVLAMCMGVTTFAVELVAIDRVTRDGQTLIVKTYEIAPGDDPDSLIESDFEDEGYTFTYLEFKTDEVKSYHSKEILFSREVETGSSSTAEIVGKFEPFIDHEEDGMVGRVYLDTASMNTVVKGYSKQSYTVSATREYGGFAYNDPSSIPRTTEKDGITLNIADINWVVTGTDLVGDSLLPNQYKAVVSYSGTAYKNVVTRYITTAAYSGIIEKTVVDKVIVTVTYAGTPLPADYTRLWWLLAALGALLLLGGMVVIIIFTVKRDVEIYNKHGDEYERIGREFIDFKRPEVNFLPHKRNSYTADYVLILRKKAAQTLMGREITIRFENKSISRKVDNDKIYISEDDEV